MINLTNMEYKLPEINRSALVSPISRYNELPFEFASRNINEPLVPINKSGRQSGALVRKEFDDIISNRNMSVMNHARPHLLRRNERNKNNMTI